MIQKVGVIFQDANSLGFLEGLKDRLRCDAELVSPPTPIGRPSVIPKRTLKLAWEYFNKQNVDLIVRLTDADGKRWQDVRRAESERIPKGTEAFWIFATAVDRIEDWLALDPQYLAEALTLDASVLSEKSGRVGQVKNAIKRKCQPNEPTPEVVTRLVRDAPPKAARKWLRDPAFAKFYSDCRAAATRAGCETTNDQESASA